MNYLTNQEIFNKVAEHLITQNNKSINDDGYCKYHSNDGLKCAVGCLITSENYNPDIEGESVISLKDILKNIDFKNSSTLLVELQKTHDNYSVSRWKERLISIGDFYNLILPDCLSTSLGE